MKVFTQSIVQSGIIGLRPIGFVSVEDVALTDNRCGSGVLNEAELFTAALKEKYPEIDYVFNIQIDRWLEGHPSNNYVRGRIRGDGYKTI
jgi:hypothetical protein